MLTLCTHVIMIFGGMNGQLASGISRKEKMMKSLKRVFQILKIRSQLKKKTQLKEEMFRSCLLNKSVKKKKQHRLRQKGSVCQLRYGLHQQHMIPTKCARFISRHFLNMMHSRLNCETVATLLIIVHRRLLFD